MNDGVKELIKLVQENPDAEVICMTDTDVVGDGSFGDYLSEIHSCRLGEYVCYSERVFDDREDFKEEYYDMNADELNKRFGYAVQFDDTEYTEEEWEQHEKAAKALEDYLDGLAEKWFKKAIIVYITVPTTIDMNECTESEPEDLKKEKEN